MRIDYMVRVGAADNSTFEVGLKSEEERNAFLAKLDVKKVRVLAQWTDYVSHSASEAYHELGRRLPGTTSYP